MRCMLHHLRSICLLKKGEGGTKRGNVCSVALPAISAEGSLRRSAGLRHPSMVVYASKEQEKGRDSTWSCPSSSHTSPYARIFDTNIDARMDVQCRTA